MSLTPGEQAAFDKIMAAPEITDQLIAELEATEDGREVLALMEAMIPPPTKPGPQVET